MNKELNGKFVTDGIIRYEIDHAGRVFKMTGRNHEYMLYAADDIKWFISAYNESESLREKQKSELQSLRAENERLRYELSLFDTEPNYEESNNE